MDKKAIATDEQMMAEAAVRMKRIGFPQKYIDEFLSASDVKVFLNGVVDESDEDLDRFAYESVESFNGGYPWAMIKEISKNQEYDEVVEYHILFVSTDAESWEKEREELAAMEPTMFHYQYISRLYPDETDIRLVKRAIQVKEDGAISLK